MSTYGFHNTWHSSYEKNTKKSFCFFYKTIKNAAENNVETEKELAERMKKAKISQMSQATLENEVFEGNPPTPRPADVGPAMLHKKNSKKARIRCRYPLPPPPLVNKKISPPNKKDGCSYTVGTSFSFPPPGQHKWQYPPPPPYAHQQQKEKGGGGLPPPIQQHPSL